MSVSSQRSHHAPRDEPLCGKALLQPIRGLAVISHARKRLVSAERDGYVSRRHSAILSKNGFVQDHTLGYNSLGRRSIAESRAAGDGFRERLRLRLYFSSSGGSRHRQTMYRASSPEEDRNLKTCGSGLND